MYSKLKKVMLRKKFHCVLSFPSFFKNISSSSSGNASRSLFTPSCCRHRFRNLIQQKQKQKYKKITADKISSGGFFYRTIIGCFPVSWMMMVGLCSYGMTITACATLPEKEHPQLLQREKNKKKEKDSKNSTSTTVCKAHSPSKGEKNVNTTDRSGRSLIYLAAREGHLDCIRQLVHLGANVNLARDDGATPIFVAAEEGNVEAVKLLAELGADVNQPTKEGATPISIATWYGEKEVVKVLAEQPISAQLNITSDHQGETPVFTACQQGREEILDILVQHGGDVLLGNEDGATPLFAAAQCGHTHVVEKLLSILQFKSSCGNKEKNEASADVAAGVNAKMNDGATPLFAASAQGYPEIVQLLAQYGGNVNAAINKGATPLFVAAYRGQASTIAVLVKLGADVNKPYCGSTPLDAAMAKGYKDCVEILKKSHAVASSSS